MQFLITIIKFIILVFVWILAGDPEIRQAGLDWQVVVLGAAFVLMPLPTERTK